MSPFLSSLLSFIFLFAGAVAVYTMMAVQGKSVSRPKLYVKIHKVSGWLFVALFALLFIFMLQKVGEYWEDFSSLVALHVTLAVSALLLIALKVATPRFFSRLNKNMFALGIGVYLLSFTLVVITAGHYLIHRVKGEPYLSHAKLPEHMLDERLGKELFITKCSTCHMLKNIMQPRSVKSWEKVVNEMVVLAKPRITHDEAGQILHYLAQTHLPRLFEGPPGASLVEKHCLPCHNATEVFAKRYGRAAWMEIVRQMTEYDEQIMPPAKTGEVVDFLLKSQ